MNGIDVIASQTATGTEYFVRHDYDLDEFTGAPHTGPYADRTQAEDAAESISSILTGSAE